MKLENILLGIGFVVIVGTSIANVRAGVVVFGLLQFAAGCVAVYRQETFGLQDSGTVGPVRGFPAILLGIAAMTMGLLAIFAPRILGW
jgi:hypothetical protein